MINFDSLYEANGKLDGAYIVHAFGAHKIVTEQGLGEFSAEPDRKPYINLAELPAEINKRDALSCSLVKEGVHTATWGPAGMILRVKPQDIVATSTSDMGTHQSAEHLRNEGHLIQNPEELLTGLGYNEVVIDPRHAEIIGFFIKTHHDGIPVNPAIAEIAQHHAKRMGLPCNQLKEFNPFYQEVSLEITDGDKGKLTVTKGNLAYILYKDGEKPESFFMRLDLRKHEFSPMSEVEFTEVEALLKENGFGDNRLAAIRADFEEKREKDTLPILKEYENGFQLNFHIESGGISYLITVTASGAGAVSNKSELMKDMAQSMAGITGMSSSFNERVFASPDTTRALLTRALPVAKKYDPKIATTIQNLLGLDLETAFTNAGKLWSGKAPKPENTFDYKC